MFAFIIKSFKLPEKKKRLAGKTLHFIRGRPAGRGREQTIAASD
jgi:hypothetical protein